MGHETENRDRDDLLEGGAMKGKNFNITLDGRQGDTPRAGTLAGQPEHGRGEVERGHPSAFGGELHGQAPVTGTGVEDGALRHRPQQAPELAALIFSRL